MYNGNINFYFEEDLMIEFNKFTMNKDASFQKMDYNYFKDYFNLKFYQIYCYKVPNEENTYEVTYDIMIKDFPTIRRIVKIKNPKLISKKNRICKIEYSNDKKIINVILVTEFKFSQDKYEFKYIEESKKKFKTLVRKFDYEGSYIKVCDNKKEFILINKNGFFIGNIDWKIRKSNIIKENEIDKNKLEKITECMTYYNFVNSSFKNKYNKFEIYFAIGYYNYNKKAEAEYSWYEYYSEELIKDIEMIKEYIEK